MALPSYNEFYRDVLNALADGKTREVSEIRKIIESYHDFSTEELTKLLPSGKQTVFANRISWTTFHLRKAGLLVRPEQGKFYLSNEGKKIQANPEIVLDKEFLMKYKTYAAMFDKAATPQKVEAMQAEEETPQETIDKAYQQLNSSLADDLMQEVLNRGPIFFEHLVVRLLIEMGYGGPFEDAGIVTKATGDGGIDGIVKEDKLGFNQIYIQAKCWKPDNVVSAPEIQKFAGALLGKHVSKGLFITTAKFSGGAKDYAKGQNIVLVDGEMLTQLMIEYGLGVSTYKTYALKNIDTDFFKEME